MTILWYNLQTTLTLSEKLAGHKYFFQPLQFVQSPTNGDPTASE